MIRSGLVQPADVAQALAQKREDALAEARKRAQDTQADRIKAAVLQRSAELKQQAAELTAAKAAAGQKQPPQHRSARDRKQSRRDAPN